MLVLLLIACGGDPAPAPAPAGGNSDVTNALLQLQEGNSPSSRPTDAEPPPVPEAVAERSAAEETAAAPPTSSDSPECRAAKAKRGQIEAEATRYRESTLLQAEKNYLQAQAGANACASDRLGCGSDADKFKRYRNGEIAAAAHYEAAQSQVAVIESRLYAADQAIRAACGSDR